MQFKNRIEAGRVLAERLMHYAHGPDTLVLGLARGGVPVAFQVAQALDAPLDVFIVRKLGAPGQEELAMGAIAAGGVAIINENLMNELAVTPEALNAVMLSETKELERRERVYRRLQPALEVSGRKVILVDDGLATGSTMRAAIAALKQRQPGRLVAAVPVGAQSACDELAADVDELICFAMPEPFYSVGRWYEDFSQTTDEEILDLLAKARRVRP